MRSAACWLWAWQSRRISSAACVRVRAKPSMWSSSKAGLRTAAAALVDERAPAAVAFVNRSPDRGGDVAGFGRFRRGRRARTAARRGALLLHPFDEQVERPFEDRGEITVPHAMAQQILR